MFLAKCSQMCSPGTDMEMIKFNLIKLVLAGYIFFSPFASCLSVPTPKGMHLSWVGQEIMHNGMPINILHFSTSNKPEFILEYYRKAWAEPVSQNAPGFLENTTEQWQVVSRLEDGRNLVVQVKAKEGGGSEGYLSQMNLSGRVAIKDAYDFPKPQGSVLVSHTVGEDFKGEALTLVITSALSVNEVSNYYLQTLKSKGYSAQFNQKESGNHALFFLGKNKKIDVAIGPVATGGSAIFVNILNE